MSDIDKQTTTSEIKLYLKTAKGRKIEQILTSHGPYDSDTIIAKTNDINTSLSSVWAGMWYEDPSRSSTISGADDYTSDSQITKIAEVDYHYLTKTTLDGGTRFTTFEDNYVIYKEPDNLSTD